MESKLFYDDDLDALKATVQALGGYKQIGPKLWPDQPPDAASRRLADCCNPGRADRLKPSQLLLIMRLGREANVHTLAEYFMAEAGYDRPRPVAPADEAASLMRKLEDSLGMAAQLTQRLERLKERS
jgi:hypothetical protein